MGTIKTTNIEPIADNGTVTLGSSGDTFTLGSGVVQSNLNYPAFEASLSSSFSEVSGANTKVPLDSITFDTNSCYDNTTNYRFTPTVSGKYYVYGITTLYSGSTSRVEINRAEIHKNGTSILSAQNDYRANNIRISSSNVSGIIDMNGTTDYIELYNYAQSTAGTPQLLAQSTYKRTLCGAYRIGS
jgi:hypothetical protein